MKFRKKAVVIDAVQYTGEDVDGVCFCSVHGVFRDGIIQSHIHTLEGPHIVSRGDWIITGVKGERYPCKPDIFEATYETP